LAFRPWGEYWETEFETSWRTGYRELEAARVNRAIDQLDNGAIDPLSNGRPLPEAQARELAPLLRQEDEDAVLDLWAGLRDEYGEQLTAEKVRAAVEKKLKPKLAPAPQAPEVDRLELAKRTLSAAYGKAAGLIADWLDENPGMDAEQVCRQIAPLGWQGLLMRIEREET
jgi:hypothetical protein